MIGGRGSQLHRQRGAAEVVELVRVDLDRESQRHSLGQDLTRLLEGEGFVLAEDIHKGHRSARGVGIPPLTEHRQHCLAHEVSVALRVILVFGRDGVRAEEGEGKVKRRFVVERKQGFEQAQFGGGLQTITRFGFNCGGAVSEHAQETRTGLRDERFDGSRSRRTDRGNDSTSFSQDLKIGLACHLHLKFVCPVTTPDDMRVRVDKPGHDDAAPRIEGRFVGIGGAEFGGRADRDDLFIAHDDRAVFDDTKRSKGMTALRSAFEGEELGGGVDEHGMFQRVENSCVVI
jgi:hypothetical protein